MSQITRYGKMTAREGKADELAARMLAAAEELREDAGCELYLINRERGEPGTIWVTEVWRSQKDLDVSIEKIRGSDQVAAVQELVEGGGMVELDLLGGKGARPERDPQTPTHTLKNLADVEDMAAGHGMSDMGEARFPNGDLATEQTGLSHHKLNPKARQGFAHKHRDAEEVYVVLSGSGRVKIDDEIVDLATLDAIRIAPEATRNFEAGDEGMELLAFGPLAKGDAEMIPGWWTD